MYVCDQGTIKKLDVQTSVQTTVYMNPLLNCEEIVVVDDCLFFTDSQQRYSHLTSKTKSTKRHVCSHFNVKHKNLLKHLTMGMYMFRIIIINCYPLSCGRVFPLTKVPTIYKVVNCVPRVPSVRDFAAFHQFAF